MKVSRRFAAAPECMVVKLEKMTRSLPSLTMASCSGCNMTQPEKNS